VSNGEGSELMVNTLSSWYDWGFLLSFIMLGSIRVVGVVVVVGAVGFVVKDSDVGDGREEEADYFKESSSDNKKYLTVHLGQSSGGHYQMCCSNSCD